MRPSYSGLNTRSGCGNSRPLPLFRRGLRSLSDLGGFVSGDGPTGNRCTPMSKTRSRKQLPPFTRPGAAGILGYGADLGAVYFDNESNSSPSRATLGCSRGRLDALGPRTHWRQPSHLETEKPNKDIIERAQQDISPPRASICIAGEWVGGGRGRLQFSATGRKAINSKKRHTGPCEQKPAKPPKTPFGSYASSKPRKHAPIFLGRHAMRWRPREIITEIGTRESGPARTLVSTGRWADNGATPPLCRSQSAKARI